MAEGYDSYRKWTGIFVALAAATVAYAAVVSFLVYSDSDEPTEQQLAETHEELPETSIEDDSDDLTEEDQLATVAPSPLEDALTQVPVLSELKVLETRWGELSVLQLPLLSKSDSRSESHRGQCGFGEPRANERSWKRRELSRNGPAAAAGEAAVDSGLAWLAWQQQEDGSWNFKTGNDEKHAVDRMGATGLALLAFLGAGNTHKDGLYASTVRKGLNHLTNNMRISSAGGDLRGGAGMSSHGICAVAICDLYVITKDRDLKRSAQLAIDFIVTAQHDAGGWNDEPGQAGRLTVSGWQIDALMTGKIAKLRVPARCIGKAAAFLNSVQSDGGAQYGDDKPGSGATTTAIGILCRMYLGWTLRQPALGQGVEVVSKRGPQPYDVLFNYYAAQVMRHWGGEGWKKWKLVMREQLVKTQEQEGDAAGSWPPADDPGGQGYGGRLYATCLSILTLEAYYRYVPILQLRKTMSDGIGPAETVRDPALVPFSIDLLQTPPESVRADGSIRWERDQIMVNGSGTLRFEIPPNARRFTAVGSLNSIGSVRFAGFVDDELKFRSNEIEQGGRAEVDVPLESGKQVLELIVDFNASRAPGQAVWLEPRWAGRQRTESSAAPRDPFDVALAPPLFTESDAEIRWTPQSIRPSLPGSSCVRHRIPEGAKRFSALVATLGDGAVKFDVSVDGERAFRSEEITRLNWAKIDIALKPGGQVLELRTNSTSKGAGHALWTEPRFFP